MTSSVIRTELTWALTMLSAASPTGFLCRRWDVTVRMDGQLGMLITVCMVGLRGVLLSLEPACDTCSTAATCPGTSHVMSLVFDAVLV